MSAKPSVWRTLRNLALWGLGALVVALWLLLRDWHSSSTETVGTLRITRHSVSHAAMHGSGVHRWELQTPSGWWELSQVEELTFGGLHALVSSAYGERRPQAFENEALMMVYSATSGGLLPFAPECHPLPTPVGQAIPVYPRGSDGNNYASFFREAGLMPRAAGGLTVPRSYTQVWVEGQVVHCRDVRSLPGYTELFVPTLGPGHDLAAVACTDEAPVHCALLAWPTQGEMQVRQRMDDADQLPAPVHRAFGLRWDMGAPVWLLEVACRPNVPCWDADGRKTARKEPYPVGQRLPDAGAEEP